MKVAIDGGPLKGADAIRGIGFHTKELIERLQKIKKLDLKVIDFSSNNLGEFDILHYPYFHPHFLTLPFFKHNAKIILTIHDLIRLIYPKSYPPGIKGSLRFLIQKFNLQNVDAIITISETSKKDIVRLLNIPAKKIHVIYLAPQSTTSNFTKSKLAKLRAKYKLPSKFVLYVGDVNYNKNILNLAKACKLSKLPLVMVGKNASNNSIDNSNIENNIWNKFLKEFGTDKNIHRVGFIPTDELSGFYKLASVYCQPSLYEGFGLAILEAFMNECPVVASKTQALKEIGEDGCFYVDPNSCENMAQALFQVTEKKSLREQLVKNGKKRVGNFNWEKTAWQTYEVYRKIFNEP